MSGKILANSLQIVKAWLMGTDESNTAPKKEVWIDVTTNSQEVGQTSLVINKDITMSEGYFVVGVDGVNHGIPMYLNPLYKKKNIVMAGTVKQVYQEKWVLLIETVEVRVTWEQFQI